MLLVSSARVLITLLKVAMNSKQTGHKHEERVAIVWREAVSISEAVDVPLALVSPLTSRSQRASFENTPPTHTATCSCFVLIVFPGLFCLE